VSRGTVLDHMDRAASGDAQVHLLRTGESVRWSALWGDALRCAGWIERAFPADRAVAGLLEPTRACLAALLGTWLAGRSFVSLPAPSRGMAAGDHRDHILALVELAGAGVVVATGLGDLGRDLQVCTLGYEDFGRARAATGAETGRLVQFTSGSTDRPRGVVLDMAQVGANAAAMARRVEVGPADAFFSWLPLSHDMGLIGMGVAAFASFDPALGGARAVWLSEPLRFMRAPLSWLRLASDVGGSITAVPNFALDLVTRRLGGAPNGLDLSSLRCLIVGSETVDAGTLRRFAGAAGPHRFRELALCPAYGLAEATLAVTIVPPGTRWSTHAADGGGPVALGPVVEDMELRVRTAGDGRDELEIRGASVAHTFLGRPGEHSEDGWLRTGDLGFVQDGVLYFNGRAGGRLVVRGRNIDADSLQRRLGELSGVRAGCCAVIADGDDGYSVVIEATGRREDDDMSRLCRAVADAAARWSGVSPGRVCVVGRGKLPKTPSGKLQRHRLRDRLADESLVPIAEAAGLRRPGRGAR
jgi:acyl-CoA synthetase (AMP-forming)/AMP-acid ligase II